MMRHNVTVIVASRQLAHSVLYFDGHSVLPLRDQGITKVFSDMFLSLSEPCLNRIFTELNVLSGWANWGLSQMYRFCLEPMNRGISTMVSNMPR